MVNIYETEYDRKVTNVSDPMNVRLLLPLSLYLRIVFKYQSIKSKSYCLINNSSDKNCAIDTYKFNTSYR